MAYRRSAQFGNTSLKSEYVYQIYAYLMSQDAHEPDTKSEGLMLHPSLGEDLDEEVVIQGHRIRFATVDLMASPRRIADELLAAVSETPSATTQTSGDGAH